MPVRITDESPEVSAQQEFYNNSVGSSTTIEVIHELIAFSENANASDCRSGRGNWYELPENDGLDKRAWAIARKWLEVRGHGTAAGEGHMLMPWTGRKEHQTSCKPCRKTCSTGRRIITEGVQVLSVPGDVRPKFVVSARPPRDRSQATGHGIHRSRRPWTTQRVSIQTQLWSGRLCGRMCQAAHTAHGRWTCCLFLAGHVA